MGTKLIPVDPNGVIDVTPTVLLDGAVFNLKVLQKLLGQTQDSAKKCADRHNIPAIKGRTWIFSGRLLREVLEPAMLEQLKRRADKTAFKK
jgi:hypothetical protein